MHAATGKVVVAMSGGVDSSYVAMLLLERGHDVVGVTLNLHEHSEAAIQDAKNVAEKLGIQHYVIDARNEFKKRVIDEFINSYASGQTPNPCSLCNRDIKSKLILDFARSMKAEKIATGHYAILERRGEDVLLKESNKDKDQSYFLSLIPRDSLKSMMFPLGRIQKPEIRAAMAKKGFDVARKKDSQDICFIPSNDYKAFLRKQEYYVIAKMFKDGDIVYNGDAIGKHSGIANYTIGQRRGLNISHEHPLYVKSIDAANNVVIVADKDNVAMRSFVARNFNWILPHGASCFDAEVKVRAGANKLKATIEVDGDNVRVEITDETNKLIRSAPAPGQICTIYLGEIVLGGGIISEDGLRAKVTQARDS